MPLCTCVARIQRACSHQTFYPGAYAGPDWGCAFTQWMNGNRPENRGSNLEPSRTLHIIRWRELKTVDFSCEEFLIPGAGRLISVPGSGPFESLSC